MKLSGSPAAKIVRKAKVKVFAQHEVFQGSQAEMTDGEHCRVAQSIYENINKDIH